jgi:hypothetical protein
VVTYTWSSKRNKNGARNEFYKNMRNVAQGDVISFFSGHTWPFTGRGRPPSKW